MKRVLAVGAIALLMIALYHTYAEEPQSAREKLAAAATAVREETARRPFPFRDIPVYHAASKDDIAGAGFIVKSGESFFAVSATHAHPDKPPTEFVNDQRQVAIGKTLYQQDDITVSAVDAPVEPSFQLIRDEGRILKMGDEVAVICHDRIETGTLKRGGLGIDDRLLPGELGPFKLSTWIQGKRDFAGNSGAPVVLVETGEVIGVLLSAVQMTRETAVDFELLRVKQEPKPTTDPAPLPAIFSLHAAREAPPALMTTFLSAVLPRNVLEIAPGMQLGEVLAKRPYLASDGSPVAKYRSFYEFLGWRRIFNRLIVKARDGQIESTEFEGGFPIPSATRIEAAFDFFLTTLGEPSMAFTFHPNGRKTRVGSVYCVWKGAGAKIVLSVRCFGHDDMFLGLRVLKPETDLASVLDMKRAASLPSDTESVHKELGVCIRDIGQLSNADEAAK